MKRYFAPPLALIVALFIFFGTHYTFADSNGSQPTAKQLMRTHILNRNHRGIDGPDGGNSGMGCFNEEDFEAPLDENGNRPKKILCWRNDDWHGLAGINRGWPVEIRVEPDMTTVEVITKPGLSSEYLVFEASWRITCLNCDPVIAPITLNAGYEKNLTTGRLDEILKDAATNEPINRRPIKMLNATPGKT